MKKKILSLVAALTCSNVLALAPTNLLRDWDTNFWPFSPTVKRVQWTTVGAAGFSEQGRNSAGDLVNVAQVWNAQQDALAMLKGFAPGTPQYELAQLLNVNDDNGTRGHFSVTGTFNMMFSWLNVLRFNLPQGFFIDASIPFYAMRFHHVDWDDLTPDITLEDKLTKQLLTNNIGTITETLGDGLNIYGWERSGFGDTSIFAGWFGRFLQEKDWIKEVLVSVRMGITFPTGIKADQNVIMPIAFGNDGAFALPFGAGLDVRFRKVCWAGGHLTFMHIFDHERDFRIATNPNQTSFLYLQKARARQEYGFIQIANLYIEPQFYNGFSLRCAYEHIKQSQDRFNVLDNTFSSAIANFTSSLTEWTVHQLLFQLKWDGTWQKNNNCGMCPQVSLFAVVPFNGRSSLQTHMLGISADLSF